MLIMGLVYNRSSLAHKWTKETTVWSFLYNFILLHEPILKLTLIRCWSERWYTSSTNKMGKLHILCQQTNKIKKMNKVHGIMVWIQGHLYLVLTQMDMMKNRWCGISVTASKSQHVCKVFWDLKLVCWKQIQTLITRSKWLHRLLK